MSESIQQPVPSRAEAIIQTAFDVFLRLLSLAFLVLAVQAWAMTVGVWEGANSRFDTMSTPWKIYSALAIVLLPVASVGLWTTLSWGRVIWLIAAGVQIIAFLRFPDIFGAQLWLLMFHAGSLVIYLIFQIALRISAKEV